MYNLTNYTSAIGIHEQAVALNSLSDGVLGIALIVSVYIILFVSMKRYDRDFKETFLSTSVITTMLGIPLLALGLIFWPVFVLLLIILFASLLVYKFTD